MKKNIVILVSILVFFIACDDTVIEKPKILIKKTQMVDMLVDFHLAEATFQNRSYRDSSIANTTSTDFYYSILSKYEVPDSVFEKSYVYYLSKPKSFEKMYRDVQNKLSEMEQEFTGRRNDVLDLRRRDEPR